MKVMTKRHRKTEKQSHREPRGMRDSGRAWERGASRKGEPQKGGGYIFPKRRREGRMAQHWPGKTSHREESSLLGHMVNSQPA